MNRLKYLIFSLVVFVISTSIVSAASCGYEERAKLNNEVGNIKANYEIKVRYDDGATIPDALLGTEDEETYMATIDYFQVNILNLTENVYAEVTNNYDNQTVKYNYSDTVDGNVAFEWTTIGELVTYTIKIKASNATGCEDTVLRTIKLSLPRYNDYSTYAVCAEIPDYYLCQRYVNFAEVDFIEFSDKVTKEIEKIEKAKQNEEENNNKWYQKVSNFIVENKIPFIIGGISLVVVAGVVTIVIIRRRRSSEI